MHDVATQISKTDCYIPSYSDKVLEAKKYVAATVLERHAALDAKVGMISVIFFRITDTLIVSHPLMMVLLP